MKCYLRTKKFGLWGLTLGLLAVSMTYAEPVPSEKSPKNAEVEKAEELFKAGKVEEAVKLLEEAVKKTPSLPPARLMLARLFLQANQGQAARVNLEQAAAENPEHPEVYLTMGSIALAEGRLTEVILNCRVVLQLADAERWTASQRKTYQREARAGLATAFESRRDWNSARTQFIAWLELEPQNGNARQRLARVLFQLNRPDDAFAELLNACKDDPTLDPPEVIMALLFVGAEDGKKAEEWFQKAVAKLPDSARVHQAYGGWLLDSGKLDAANIHINTAAKLDPKSRATLALRGLRARYAKDYPTAEKIFEDLLRESPADFFAGNQLALALLAQSDEKQQRRGLQLAEVNARQYNRSVEALSTLGWAYYCLNRLDDAEKALNAAASGGQITPDTAYYLAKLLFTRGRFEEAHKLLETAIASKGVFVNRTDAEAFLPEAKRKLPKKENKEAGK